MAITDTTAAIAASSSACRMRQSVKAIRRDKRRSRSLPTCTLLSVSGGFLAANDSSGRVRYFARSCYFVVPEFSASTVCA